MSRDRYQRGLGLLGNGKSDEAYDAAVWETTHHDELAKVLVQRDQDPAFVPRSREDFLVGSGGIRIAHPLRVDTLIAKLCECSAPNTGIEQYSQLSLPTATGSTRSWATRRLA